MRASAFSLLVLTAACASPKPVPAPAPAPPPPPSVVASAAPPADPLAEPPPRGITPSAPFPSVTHQRLDNGLGLAIVAERGFPVIAVRLVILSGIATDANQPGLANLTGKFLKDGGAGPYTSRELAERAEGLGARLSISTDRDSTRIGLDVTSGSLDPALEIVTALVESPRFAPNEFQKLRQREVDRVKDRARTSPGWLASMVLYRELYELPVSIHPYARYDALPDEIAALKLEDSKRWFRTHVTPENAVLVVAGNVDPAEVERLARARLGSFRGTAPPPPSFSEPHGPETRRLIVVDRPASSQSLVLVGAFGPERRSDEYPAVMAANQILGGGVSGRLFLDVREKRSLAYSTGSSVEEPAHGPMPLVLSAGTQTAKTADAVAALLEHFARIGNTAPTDDELERAARFLSDSFLFKMETAGAVADLTARLLVLGLPDEAYDDYRRAVRDLETGPVQAVAGRRYRKGAELIVVAGDAKAVAKPLARFAKVEVVDPERGFVIRETLPKE